MSTLVVVGLSMLCQSLTEPHAAVEYLDGLILHQLALAEPADPTGRINRLLAGLGLGPDPSQPAED